MPEPKDLSKKQKKEAFDLASLLMYDALAHPPLNQLVSITKLTRITLYAVCEYDIDTQILSTRMRYQLAFL